MTKDNKIDFEAFLKKNQDKIRAITPVNPSINENDEWMDNNEWNKYYDNIKEN